MRYAVLVAPLMFMLSATLANACADGPDSYRVVGVAADDVLNVRSGPALDFSVIGTLPPDAQGVQNLDQVPLNACDSAEGLTVYERQNFWTKVRWDGDGGLVIGWAKSRFLAE